MKVENEPRRGGAKRRQIAGPETDSKMKVENEPRRGGAKRGQKSGTKIGVQN